MPDAIPQSEELQEWLIKIALFIFLISLLSIIVWSPADASNIATNGEILYFEHNTFFCDFELLKSD